ncbi:MAG: PadR family transcriptional regulator [Acidimicrobiia bacterium]
MTTPDLSTTECAVLALLGERPGHGFALARQLAAGSEIGRVFTVRRSLVYRALDRLVDAGLARPVSTEKGRAGPKRIIHAITPAGRGRLDDWLAEPVEHVRDLRIEFLLKLTMLRRSQRSPTTLIKSQRAALDNTLSALDENGPDPDDHVELWRRHQAATAGSYLEALQELYRE